jgi:GNAT superfamily N-acetyltransferase
MAQERLTTLPKDGKRLPMDRAARILSSMVILATRSISARNDSSAQGLRRGRWDLVRVADIGAGYRNLPVLTSGERIARPGVLGLRDIPSPHFRIAIREQLPDDAAMATTETTVQARVEPATLEDLPQLVELLRELFEAEADFEPDRDAQERGLRLILENPSRGRIFVLRGGHKIIGMVNLLFTISTAHGGHAILMEDVVILPEYRGQGHGSRILSHVIEFARRKDFVRITLLTDRISVASQRFFQKFGFTFSEMIPMRLLLK